MPYNKSGAVNFADSHAETSSKGRCAAYVRRALEWGGVHVAPTLSAANYGASLSASGFYEVTGAPQKGDVVVIEGFAGHDDGHMAIYDGTRWISDFKQRPGPDVYPGPDYRKAQPAYKIYRHP
ncbi:CHAP domain-containing protein [Dyella sp. M7H15-1]|uniref:CHAP domain-containing protein n=1 Tax=Dyella sp. M7H15-1 TaxID=2501295 RepID=UPI00100518AE|nr:CHAP domain-containing protein [Dyella sp. M7H15-1]QAU23343.1 CHAP domain-containing protein [Dyella sp. M7H15-1]